MSSRPLVVLALAALTCAPVVAAARTPESPPLFQGGESAAYVDGAPAAFYNPAGLGLRYPADAFFSWSLAEGGGRVDRWAVDLLGFALQGERVEDGPGRCGFSLAGGPPGLRWGLATDWLVDPASHEFAADLRCGELARPAPWLSLGAVMDHALQPTFRGERLDREYTLAVGLRPLALRPGPAHGWGTRLTLTSDVTFPEGGAWSRSRVRLGGELEVLPGVLVRGSLTDHRGAHLGLTLRGANAMMGGQRAAVDGRHRYDAYAFSLHAGEERTVLAGPAERRVAVIRAAGHLGDDALSGFSLLGSDETTPVKPLHDQLERALEDPLTRGVLLDLRGVTGMAQVEELRPRIARLRRAGKPVVAYLEYGGGRADFYLAGACDRIVVPPESQWLGLGLRAERRYYRQLLADLGIKVERSSYGKYKSAYRNFSVDSTTDADRESIERTLDVNQDLLVSALAADRGVDRDRILTLLDGRPWRAEDFQRAGVIDTAGYREDALRALGRLCGLGERPRTASLESRPMARAEWAVPSPVAVVYASGDIETGRSGSDLLNGPTMGSETVIAQIEAAFRRQQTRAVVLRVESPGGSALASDLIHHATLRMKRETRKPLIVSMGSVAASGGYYISVAADRIFADRHTYTGSIGVVSIKPSLEQFYARHGVRQDDFERGAWMRGWSTNRDWRPEDQAVADSATLRFYDAFVATVAAGRGLSREDVDAVAQGRVWMGEDARQRRLVDEIGGLEEAVAEARRRAGVPAGAHIRLCEYRRPRPGFLHRLVSQSLGAAWREATRLPEPGTVLYRMDDDEAE